MLPPPNLGNQLTDTTAVPVSKAQVSSKEHDGQPLVNTTFRKTSPDRLRDLQRADDILTQINSFTEKRHIIESICGHIAYRYRQGILYQEITKGIHFTKQKMHGILNLAKLLITFIIKVISIIIIIIYEWYLLYTRILPF